VTAVTSGDVTGITLMNDAGGVGDPCGSLAGHMIITVSLFRRHRSAAISNDDPRLDVCAGQEGQTDYSVLLTPR
jgi:hypothetical protein